MLKVIDTDLVTLYVIEKAQRQSRHQRATNYRAIAQIERKISAILGRPSKKARYSRRVGRAKVAQLNRKYRS